MADTNKKLFFFVFQFDRSIFDKTTKPAKSGAAAKFPEITHGYESTKSKEMFFSKSCQTLSWFEFTVEFQ